MRRSELGDDRLDQGNDRDEQHEAHRNVEHFVVLADVAEPCAHRDQAERGEQLVGGAEQGPDLGVAGHAERDAGHNGDQSGKVRIDEDLPVVLDIRGRLAVDEPEFLEHVAGKTSRCVERSQAKYRDRQHQHLVHDILNAFIGEGADHLGNAGRENCSGRSKGRGKFAGICRDLSDGV